MGPAWCCTLTPLCHGPIIAEEVRPARLPLIAVAEEGVDDMADGNQNPATVSRLSAQEGDRQKFYYPPAELAQNSNIMAYAREKGFASTEELYAWTIAHPQDFWSEM